MFGCALLKVRVAGHLCLLMLSMITLIEQFVKCISENEYFLMWVYIGCDDGLIGVSIVKQQKRRNEHLHKGDVVQGRKKRVAD